MIVYAVICRAKDAAFLAEAFVIATFVNGRRDEKSKSSVTNIPPIVAGIFQHLRDHPPPSTTPQNAFSIPLQTTDDNSIELGSLQDHFLHILFENGVFYGALSDDDAMKDHKV